MNHVIHRVHNKSSTVKFTQVGSNKELVVYGITDASFKTDEKSIGGVIILLGNKINNCVNPIFWKSKTIQKVCHSAKAAETRSMIKLLDDSQFFCTQLEQLLYGDYKKRIPIKLFTDSKPLLESISSTHQVEERLLRNSITDMKEVLYGGEIQSYSWLDGETAMVADAMTKENKMEEHVTDIVLRNQFKFVLNEDNLVRCVLGEIKMEKKCNKKEKSDESMD